MKKVMLGLLMALMSCTPGKDETANTSVAVSEFNKFRNEHSDLVLVDVRTPEEIAGGKIAGSIAIDFSVSDFHQQIDKLDKDKTYVVYCAVGGRSGKTVEYMRQKGFRHAYNLEGGITQWIKEGQPLAE